MINQLNLDKIYQASFMLKKVARYTDMIQTKDVSKDFKLYLKTENLQNTGSFKLRGAYNKISNLTKEELGKGVVACSAGNHAQGVALAAASFGAKSKIFMPASAPISKVEATKSYGAEVILTGDNYDDAQKACTEYVKANDMTFIHPFDDIDVIAGQATIGLEILEQLDDVNNIIVPIGGGGLISGVSYAVKQLNKNVKIIGVQAANAASMQNSINHDEKTTLSRVDTFADGIAVKRPGDNTFEFVRKYVDDIVTVSEDEIAYSILWLMEKQKLVCEGAGSVSVSAALFDKIKLSGKTCCVLSGGNIDVNNLSRVIHRGLLVSGRRAELTISLVDKPGQLTDVSNIIAGMGGNVTGVFYNQGQENTAINSCLLMLQLETRNKEHIHQIKDKLRESGFNIVENE